MAIGNDLEVGNIYTTEGSVYPSGVEHKTLLVTGDRLCCFYYKLPVNPQKDVMEGAHSHLAEAVFFVIDGELEVNYGGKEATLKKGDAVLVPFNTIIGSRVISSTPAEMLVVASPNSLPDDVRLRKLTPETEEHRH